MCIMNYDQFHYNLKSTGKKSLTLPLTCESKARSCGASRQWDSSAGKRAHHQVYQPEFNSQNPHDRREPTLAAALWLWHVYHLEWCRLLCSDLQNILPMQEWTAGPAPEQLPLPCSQPLQQLSVLSCTACFSEVNVIAHNLFSTATQWISLCLKSILHTHTHPTFPLIKNSLTKSWQFKQWNQLGWSI